MAKQITLGVEENGISFTFDESTHYLYGDGKIVCPKNSLILVTDESEMFTLKKANGDVFISARYDAVEGISSKEDLVDWFIENAVSTGGGGGIDPETLAELVSSAEYVSSSSTIDFKNVDGEVISTINAEPFITDGMVDNVQISGNNLVITFNVDAGKQPISIPLSNIFDPSNYYDKSATDALLSGKADTTLVNAIAGQVATKVAMSTYNAYTAATNTALSGKADVSAVTAVSDALNGKQDTLEYYHEMDDEAYIEIKGADFDNGVWAYVYGVDIYASGDTNVLTVSPTAVTINGDPVVTESMLDDALADKQDTLLFYTEEDNTEDGFKRAKIETVIEDTENGVTKAAYVETQTEDTTPFAEIYASTEVNNSEESYQKSADVYVDSEDGLYLGYQTQDDNEQTYSEAKLEIGANGISLNVDNGVDIVQVDVTAEGVDIDGDAVVTESQLIDYATVASLSGKQDTLVAGSGITISGNVISADGGSGGGMSEDDELLLATALVDLNDRKMDTADAKAEFAKYQKKGDYATNAAMDTFSAATDTKLATKANAADVPTLTDYMDSQKVASYALNDLNNRVTTVETALGGLSLSAITQSQWATISGSANPSTIYIITNNE